MPRPEIVVQARLLGLAQETCPQRRVDDVVGDAFPFLEGRRRIRRLVLALSLHTQRRRIHDQIRGELGAGLPGADLQTELVGEDAGRGFGAVRDEQLAGRN